MSKLVGVTLAEKAKTSFTNSAVAKLCLWPVDARAWVVAFHKGRAARSVQCQLSKSQFQDVLPDGGRSWDCALGARFVGSVSMSIHLMERSEQHSGAVTVSIGRSEC